MATAQHAILKPQVIGRLLMVVLFVIALFEVLSQAGKFHDSLHALGQARVGWLPVAVAGLLMSYCAAAGVYRLLAKKPFSYPRAVLVQIASMCANRLLPAGSGAIGVNYRFLRRNRHTPAEAGAVVTVNNLLGFVGNTILVLCLVVITGAAWPKVAVNTRIWIGITVILAIVGIVVTVVQSVRQKVFQAVQSLGSNILSYRRRPGNVVAAVIVSIGLTATYSLMLLASCRAVGIMLSFTQLTIIMSVGVAGATATPTPGGLGGAEAALTAALVVYGVPASTALAAVLLYRAVTYWLPLFLGAAALLVTVRRKYI